MSYTPTTWQTGDTITAEKLNHMESGIENVNEPFIVTLTPTAQDYSGTMDKTVAEINEAYTAGQDIWFKVFYDQVGSYVNIPACVQHGSGATTEGFFATVCFTNMLIVATTGKNPPPDRTTYSTAVYSLTPMS